MNQTNKECQFESDGEKHSCVSSCDGIVENCRKCHKDKCSNPECPLGKGQNQTKEGWGSEYKKFMRERHDPIAGATDSIFPNDRKVLLPDTCPICKANGKAIIDDSIKFFAMTLKEAEQRVVRGITERLELKRQMLKDTIEVPIYFGEYRALGWVIDKIKHQYNITE